VDEQFAFAGWTLSLRRNDDGVHGRVDDLHLAERANKGMVKKIEFNGAHGAKS